MDYLYFAALAHQTTAMRVRCSSHLIPAVALLVATAPGRVHALPEAKALAGPSSEAPSLYPRDEHHHAHGHSAPLLELNETLILQWHKPTPPSYGTHDFEDPDVTHKYPHLMALHVVFMSLAFFGALPIGACLRFFVGRI